MRDPESDKLRILMAAEIDRAGNRRRQLALAYSLVDDKGHLIDSQIDRQVKTPVDPETSLQRYTGFILSGASGTHTLKIAVVDDRGRRGSVEYSFKAALTPLGSVRATDILISDEKTGTGSAAPSVRGEVTSGVVTSYIELYSDESDLLKNTTVMFEVAQDDKARALDGAAGRVQPATADSPNRRALEGSIPVSVLPPGDYTVRAVITTDGQKVGQVTRPFRVGRTVAAATKSKGGITTRTTMTRATSVAVTVRTDRFDRASVLTPQVVSFFVERLDVGARGEPNPEPVLDHARAGRFDDAVKALSTGPSSMPAAFLTGLALYSKGELEPAAAKFRETLRLDSEFFPAAFYLGSCYASGGRDQEAVGAWQLALVTESEAPFIYTLLGDALLRLREVDNAMNILGQAATQWPDNEDVQVRIGAALAMAGKRADALSKFEPYLAGILMTWSATSRRCACSTRRAPTANRSSRRTRTKSSSAAGPQPIPPPKDRNWPWSSSGRRPLAGSVSGLQPPRAGTGLILQVASLLRKGRQLPEEDAHASSRAFHFRRRCRHLRRDRCRKFRIGEPESFCGTPEA